MFLEMLSHQLARPQTIRLKSASWMIPFWRRSAEQTITLFHQFWLQPAPQQFLSLTLPNVIKRPQCSGSHFTHFKVFWGKPHCLITHPNTTTSFPLKKCKFENFDSSVKPEVSGRPQSTPLAVERITLSNVVNTGFLHNYLIPFTRLRKYWLFIAIKGPDCKKQVKVSGYF